MRLVGACMDEVNRKIDSLYLAISDSQHFPD